MHIPDNYLSPASCALLAVAAAPAIGLSIAKVKVQLKENKELAPMLGVGGALLAILIGPYAVSLALSMALILQAFLFGDG